MAKLISMFSLLIALQVALLIFTNTGSGNDINASTNCAFDVDGNLICTEGASSSSIWNFVMNIDNWNNTNFILAIVGIAGLTALAGIAVGSAFGFKTDFLVFGGAVAGFIGLGSVMIQLAGVIRNVASQVLTNPTQGIYCNGCVQANFIAAVIVGPIALLYVMTIVDWWRGRDS